MANLPIPATGARRLASVLALVALAWHVAAPTGALEAAPARQALDVTIALPLVMARADVAALPVPAAATPAPTASATFAPPSPTATVPPTDTPTVEPTPSGYHEPLTDHPDLDDLRAGYAPGQWYEVLLDVLDRRYATGRSIVTRLDDSRTNAARWTSGRTRSFDDLLGAAELTVHEMNHQLGWQEGLLKTFDHYAFVVRDDRTVLVTRHDTFNRSEIARYVTGPLDNQYKAIYLQGQSGQQGFFTLLDELNAYTHSLFTGYGLHDQYAPGRRVSHRDGLVTFMMYTEFYLRHGREFHPADYETLHSDPEVRDLVELLWARAGFILDVTADIGGLALDPAAVEAEMRKPDMLAEIERFVAP